LADIDAGFDVETSRPAGSVERRFAFPFGRYCLLREILHLCLTDASRRRENCFFAAAERKLETDRSITSARSLRVLSPKRGGLVNPLVMTGWRGWGLSPSIPFVNPVSLLRGRGDSAPRSLRKRFRFSSRMPCAFACYPWRNFPSDIRARCGRFPRAIARKGSRAVRRGPTVFPSAVLYLYHRQTACTFVVNAPIWKSETNARRKIERRWSDVSLPPWNSLRSPPIYDDPRARLGDPCTANGSPTR